MILHIFGGGSGQLSAIQRCRNLGIKTFVTDTNISAPGCLEADFSAQASTFDAEQTYQAAVLFQKLHGQKIEAMLVTGTDQPVLTAALTAEKLGIKYFLNTEQALLVTNKKSMKRRLTEHNIPVAPYRIIGPDFRDADLNGLRFPVVTKPLDSQGQRGVYRLDNIQHIRQHFSEIVSYSRCKEILVEEYYPSTEITLSGWLIDGHLHILSVTDRVTVDNPPGIGVCISHRFPSIHNHDIQEIRKLTEKIVDAFKLTSGPLYFQYLVGAEGLIVNEIACRLGGAYEDKFIPFITGINILDVMINFSCRHDYEESAFKMLKLQGVVSLQMFFCSPGKIASQSGMKEVLQMDGVISGQFLLKPGDVVYERLNSTQRAGYFIVCTDTQEKADQIVESAYSKLRIKDTSNRNLIQFYDKIFFRN